MYVFQHNLNLQKLTYKEQRMLTVVIMLTPGQRNEFIHWHQAKVDIAVQPFMEMKTYRNSTGELFNCTNRLREMTDEWLNIPKYRDYGALFTTEDKWMIVNYVMVVLRQFWYWSLWMLKRHTVTLHRIIIVNNHMFDHMDSVMRGLAKTMTKWNEHLIFAVNFAWLKLFKYYTGVTPTTGMLLIWAYIRYPFWKLRSFRKWGKGMEVNPIDDPSYTTQYQEAFLMYIEKY